MIQIFFVGYWKYFYHLLLSAVELAEREAGHGGGVADGEGGECPLVVRHGRGQVGVGHALPQVGLEPVTPVFAVFVSAEPPRVPPRQLVEDPPVHLAALLVPAPHRGRGRGGGDGEGGHQQQGGQHQHPYTGHRHLVTQSHCHCSVTQQLRPSCSHLPVLIVTPHTDTEDNAACFAALVALTLVVAVQ